MKTLVLKPQHETSVIGQLLSLKSQINHHNQNIAPFYYNMIACEVKEYTAVNGENEAMFADLKKYLIGNEAVFNALLSQYNLSTSVFVNKYLLN